MNRDRERAKMVLDQHVEHGDPEAALYTETHGKCPSCGWEMSEIDAPHFCWNCGQAIKWEEDEE